ncbi:MAG: signal peptidase I [Candidatus Woykebacteria bacterium RBG_16_44_10]|uniref:Signal peptidase I n=1 Tax=Candidatus Woykebacteria bacterium RBG_16_44_10 TaxID=1802597 RepID=A0A1G1WFG8_9BACT|nr:MAG: signal peptidase I [Candidatus Woykebacteria bacterium RBG_16_44_10]
MKFALNAFYALFIVAVVAFGAAVALSVFAGPGNFRAFVVGSGSMDPALKTGSVALVAPKGWAKEFISPEPRPMFEKGDIITYLSGKESITHRVVAVEKTDAQFAYETKGDANKTPDQGKVAEKQILGKVILTVPYVGLAVNFAKTQLGYIFLVVVPITLIIYSEILAIFSETRKIFARRRSAVT